MKRILLFLMLLTCLNTIGQVTPSKVLKVVSNVTLFNENIPKGTLIIDNNASKQYLTLQAIVSTKSISTCTLNTDIIEIKPDQTVAFTNGTGISVTGTYPNFTITNSSPSSGGTVTSVSGTSPIVSSGGNTPAISINQSGTASNGYLSYTDWNTFNNKVTFPGFGTVTNKAWGFDSHPTTLSGYGITDTPWTAYQPLENQRLSTTNSPTFGAGTTISGAYPYLTIYSSYWGANTYIQTGVKEDGNITGDYLQFYNPASKGFNFLMGNTPKFTINTSGNISTGIWNASTIGVPYGGTGATSLGSSLTNSGGVLNTVQDIRTSASPAFSSVILKNSASVNSLLTIQSYASTTQIGAVKYDQNNDYFKIINNSNYTGSGIGFYTNSNETTPALFINNSYNATFNGSVTLPLTGILKGNGSSAVTAAVAGTDYSPAHSATANYLLKSTGSGGIGQSSIKEDANGVGVGDAVLGNAGKSTLYLTGASYSPQITTKPGLYHRATVGMGIFSDYHISFEVMGEVSLTEMMRLTDAGLAIGTTDPAGYKLNVNGTGYFGGSVTSPVNFTTTGSGVFNFSANSGGGQWQMGSDGTTGTDMYLYHSTGYYSMKLSPTGNVKFNGSTTASSFVKSGGTPDQALMANGSTSSLPTFKVESFTESTTGSTGTVFTLSNTPKSSTSINVTLNGTPLKTSQYTLSGATVQVTIPSCQYDNLNISYSYSY